MRRIASGVFVVALGASACTSTTTVTARTFNRPVQAAFVCLETATGYPRSMSDCELLADGSSPSGLAMHALVLQQARGEIAAIDLVNRTVIDSDPGVPGYTFVPVGALPTGMAVPASGPQCAFVASAGESKVDVIDLRAFRREGLDEAGTFASVELPASPSGLVLSPDETALWLPLPDRGSVVRIPIGDDRCTLGAAEEVTLTTTVPEAAEWDGHGDLGLFCPTDYDPDAPAAVAPRTYDATGLDARPVAIAMGREVLVADASLPIVHRIDLTTGDELDPINVGAPTRGLVVTPEVPDTYSATDANSGARSRFVYAIDDDDGTVMAVDYSDPSSEGFGAVIPVNGDTAARPDRLPFLSGARVLEVLSPSYDSFDPFGGVCDPTIDDPDTSDADPSAAALRGVFLAVGLTDSTVRVVDVFDQDAPCRGRSRGPSTEACSGLSQDLFIYIRRHRPRMGVNTTNVGASATSVAFSVDGASYTLSTTEQSDSFPMTELACAALGLDPVFETLGDEGASRVCADNDPYATLAQSWVATWEGLLSGSASSSGNFSQVDDSTVALDARIDFCAAGVLGSENLVGLDASAPEARSAGDTLVITSDLPDATATDDTCRAVIGLEGGSSEQRDVILPIRAAYTTPDGLLPPYTGRLVLDLSTPVLDRSTALTLADVLRCFGDELVTFEVHVRDGFNVIGSRTGQTSRVVRGADGLCSVDTTQDARRSSRAWVGIPYTGVDLAFQIDAEPTHENTSLVITIGDVPSSLLFDIGSLASSSSTVATSTSRSLALPSDLRWNQVYQRFYMVDVERRGLIETKVQPVAYTSNRFE